MIHASVEFLEAVKGIAPKWCDPLADLSSLAQEAPHRRRACDGEPDRAELAWVGTSDAARPLEHRHPVTCAACLALMRDARGPEWDVVESNLSRLDAARRAG